MFAPRQLYGRCTSVQIFSDLAGEIQGVHLHEDPTFKNALEALLNVLPCTAAAGKDAAALSGPASDFAALQKLRRLAFSGDISAPKIPEALRIEFEGGPAIR